MGYNTSMLILNDAVHYIKDDPEFGRKVHDAVLRVHGSEPIDISVGGHCNAATVIETHHADGYVLLLAGGNTMFKLGYAGHWSKDPRKVEDLRVLLNNVAEEYGLQVIKSRKKRVLERVAKKQKDE